MPKPEQTAVAVVGGPGGQQEPRAVVLVEEKPPLQAAAPAGNDDIMPLIHLALEKGGDAVAQIERLVDLKIKLADREAAREFAEAMARFQAECPPIRKNATGKVATDSGTKFEYKYAQLPMIAKTIAPYLAKNGLSYSWDTPEMMQGNITVVCTVRHVNGHSQTSRCVIPTGSRAGMSDQQKIGSARTFGERLSLIQALGLTTADPDMDGMNEPEVGPTITQEQADELQALIESRGTSKVKLLAWLSVGALTEIPAKKFQLAIAAVNEAGDAKDRKKGA